MDNKLSSLSETQVKEYLEDDFTEEQEFILRKVMIEYPK